MSVATAIRRALPVDQEIRRLGRALSGLRRPGDLVLRSTLLLALLHGGSSWDVTIPARVLATLMLLHTRLTWNPTLWVLLTSVLVYGLMGNLYVVDNHKVLLCYWCIGISLWLRLPDMESLRLLARIMIVLVFLLAVVWKALSGDFLDGSFATFTLLHDERFQPLARFVLGVTQDQLRADRDVIARVLQGGEDAGQIAVPAGVKALSIGFTWFTMVIETLVFVLFGLGRRLGRLAALRHAPLLVFMWTTYAIANVIGFGWLLATMGFAQCLPDERKSQLAFLLTPLALITFQLPWSRIL